jgi:uncharacterized protein (DUF1800 family)
MAGSPDPRMTVLALHRFGLGARPGDLAAIGSGVRELFLSEINPKSVAMPEIGSSIRSTIEVGAAFHRFNDKERMERAAKAAQALTPPANAASGMSAMMGDMQPGDVMRSGEMQAGMTAPAVTAPAMPGAAPTQNANPRRDDPENPGLIYREEVRARVLVALTPLGGFAERWVQFWSNHFCISAAKGGIVRAMAGVFEREAVRPHVFGRFADLLIAVESHPAMLVYLDNQQSIGPSSRAGQNRRRGLNENLAREILELHTLGVAGGYSQADVTTLARIITGWSVVNSEGKLGPPGSFVFNANLHEPGVQTLLGKTYPEGGVEQGRAALLDIARHASTAQHIARKLARHFVADEPSAPLVAKLAKVFRDFDGDLQVLAKTLIEAPESWTSEAQKIRSPQEFYIAAMRAFQRKPEVNQIMGPLGAMGQRLWEPPGPNGYSDKLADWASPEGLKTRLDVASAIAWNVAPGIVDPRTVVGDLLGPLASNETRQAVDRAATKQQALALFLMSPEFQRR